jgi:hypothetical protein
LIHFPPCFGLSEQPFKNQPPPFYHTVPGRN